MSKTQDSASRPSNLWALALQLAAIPVYVFAASALSKWKFVVPAALKKQTPLDQSQLIFICGVFLIWHALAIILARRFFGPRPFSTLRRGAIELIFSLVATSFSSSALFLLTDLPFSANFYAWIYLLETGSIILTTLILASVDRTEGKQALLGELGQVAKLILKPWVWLACVLILLPGILALLYKAEPDFANAVNLTRATLSSGGSTSLGLQTAIKDIDQPISAQFHPEDEGQMFWLSRPGRLMISNMSPWSQDVLVDISDDVGLLEGEMGAFTFALHPEFGQPGSSNRGYVYIWYTHWNNGEQRNRLARFDISQQSLEERQATKTVLMDYPRKNSQMHNGGTLLFGKDGFLYLSVGDAVDFGLTQVLDKQLASGILRIDVDQKGGEISAPIERRGEGAVTQNYFIPKDNPWFNHPTALQEYWAIGFRNPFRMSMDSETGDIWLGDVGWDGFEEINRVQAGDNGQWPYMEGIQRTRLEKPKEIPGREISPIHFYAQTALKRAVIGGFIYHGHKFPQLTGKYVFADNNAGLILAFDPQDPSKEAEVLTRAGQFAQYGITSLFSDQAGNIYLTVLGGKEKPSGHLLQLASQTESTGGQEEVAQQQEAKNIDEQYATFCSRCHGEDGKGSPELGEQLVPRPDFTSADWQAKVTDEHLHKVIAEGGASQGLSEQMPAWGTVFSAAEVDQLVSKVRKFAEPK